MLVNVRHERDGIKLDEGLRIRERHPHTRRPRSTPYSGTELPGCVLPQILRGCGFMAGMIRCCRFDSGHVICRRGLIRDTSMNSS